MEAVTSRRKIAFVVAGILGLLLIAFAIGNFSSSEEEAPPQQVAEEFFEIGLLVPQSGSESRYGESALIGARLAVDTINSQGGVLGKKIRLRVEDTGSQANVARDKASALLSDKKVAIVMGTLLQETTRAVIPVLHDASIPFIYFSGGQNISCFYDRKTKERSLAPYVWGAGMTREMAVEPLLLYLAQQFTKPEQHLRLYFFSTDEPGQEQTSRFIREAAEDLGFVIVEQVFVDPRISDYYPSIRRIFGTESDALVASIAGKAGVRFLKQADQFGLGKSLAISGYTSIQSEDLADYGSTANGIVLVERYSAALETKANKEFLARIRQFQNDPNFSPSPTVVASAYSSMMLGAQAFNEAKSEKAKAFREKFDGLELEMPHGKVYVNPTSHMFDHPLYILAVENGDMKVLQSVGQVRHPELAGCRFQLN